MRISYILTSLVVIGFTVLTNAYMYNVYHHTQSLPTEYGFPTPYPMDLMQYVWMIKSGQEGRLLFHNQYSEQYFPPMLLQPHYNILGLLTAPFRISPFHVYTIARFVAFSLLILFVVYSFFTLIKNFFKYIGLLFWITSTSAYYLISNDITKAVDVETYSNWFNVIKKFIHIPPHHYIASLMIILLWIRLPKLSLTIFSLAATFASFFLLSFLHPYIVMFLIYFFIFTTVSAAMFNRKKTPILLSHCVTALIAAAPSIVYNRYLLTFVWQNASTASADTIFWSPPAVSLPNYLLALGPLFIPFFISLVIPSHWKNLQTRFLIVWGLLPIGLYYMPNVGIPTGGIRVFQTYQHIPLALLSAYTLSKITIIPTLLRNTLVMLFTMFCMVFAVPPFLTNLLEYSSPNIHYSNTARLIVTMAPIYNYLKTKTEYRSVILASEALSTTIPAISHNKVILGHDGNTTHYNEKKHQIGLFYNNYLSNEEVYNLLVSLKVDYIVWGYDVMSFNDSKYNTLPYFQKVFEINSISVTRVVLK